MAGSSERKKTRRLIMCFVSSSILLIGISVSCLLYLDHSTNKLTRSLYNGVYQNSELILNADRDLYQAALALREALDAEATGSDVLRHAQDFGDNTSQAQQRIDMAGYTIAGLAESNSGSVPARRILSELHQEMERAHQRLVEWRSAGQELLTLRSQSGWDPGDARTDLIQGRIDEVHNHLDRSGLLLDDYARQHNLELTEHKSSLYALYTILLSLLFLVILYLCRKLAAQQNEMLEEKSHYHLIGETMSDFIILTNPSGFIQYASPSHGSVLGYVPQKGAPLSNYIREAEISWGKLKNQLQDAPRIVELRMRAKEGYWVWLETKISQIGGSGALPVQFMLVSREITQRKQYEERLHKLAFYDHLTSIPNRAHFKMYMENLITQPEERRHHLALALLDCDRFKQLNDTLGHLAGDEFLQLLSRELQQTVKGFGQAFRIGGDEFAVVLHHYDSLDMLHEILDRLLRLFSKTWSVTGGASFHTSASIGVALYPEHGTGINELLHAADLAMYHSKKHGGNQASLYNEILDEEYAGHREG
ncbi:sensor domain-containing diguanylate cyclase [Paenibacillus tengchongensis]|uniref:sensor domain-containing diguanylate cyclase n=1 Tax=Paenibacillus tengchongensis TaxID=2608684 RepID=UPI00124F021D|nr:sensor domain-containing diguanylate cyclase [Paenibacillus tengchongensis]